MEGNGEGARADSVGSINQQNLQRRRADGGEKRTPPHHNSVQIKHCEVKLLSITPCVISAMCMQITAVKSFLFSLSD